MNPADPIVESYDAARARGDSRAAAFARAVDTYVAQRPWRGGNDAAVEVARLLLRAAAATGVAEGRFPSVAEAAPQPAISW